MIFRRLLWGFGISAATSLPFYVLFELKIISAANASGVVLSGVSALLFLFFSALIMRMHLQSVDNLHDYYFSELSTFICQLVVCDILVFCFSDNGYTTLYMPGLFFEILGMKRVAACMVVFAVYLLLIFVFPIERRIEYLSVKDELEAEARENEDEDDDDDDDPFED